MKKFLKFLLTTWLVVLFLVFGGSFCLKPLLVNGVSSVGGEQIQKGLSSVIDEELKDTITEKQKEEIVDFVQNNPTLNKMVERYLDTILEVLSGNAETLEINWEQEMNTILKEVEPILKEHNIEMDESTKQELLKELPIEELNQEINQAVQEAKSEMPRDAQMVLQMIQFVTSGMFKGILLVLIVLDLVFIALLDKNYFGWLQNLSIATIVAGIIYLITYFVCQGALNDIMEESLHATIPFDSLLQYGSCLLAIGIISIGVKIFLVKGKVEKQEA